MVVVNHLINNKRVEIDTQDASGNTPLIWAARLGHKDVVELLINRKEAPANLLCHDNIYNQTPLSWAMENKHTSVVELLLRDQHIDINAKDPYWSYNPLRWAIAERHKNIAQMLLLDSRIDKAAELSLFASADNTEFLVDLILEQPTLLKSFGGSLLQVAVVCERQQVVKKLIEAGANELWEDSHGWTPLLCAILGPQEGIRELFTDSRIKHESSMTLPHAPALTWDPRWNKVPISLDKGYLTATCTCG